MLEKKIEEHLCKRVKEAGGLAIKFTSPQRRSVPDRIVLMGSAAAGAKLREIMQDIHPEQLSDAGFARMASIIVAEMVHFVETKATGAKPTEGQLREHARLRALGFVVGVIDSKEAIDERYGK